MRLAKGLRELELPLAEVAPILLVAHDGTCGEIRESMTRTFDRAISGLGGRIEELEEARDHLSSLLQGLQQMRPKDVAVPGVEACECVRLVAEGSRVRDVRAIRSPTGCSGERYALAAHSSSVMSK